MTENEAIEILDGKTREQALYQYEANDRPYVIAQAEYIAIKALQEIKQYRELGTVDEIEEILQIISEGQDDVDESGISTGLLRTLLKYAEYAKIGTVEECLEARERQVAKKPKHFYKKYGKHKWRRKENGEIDDSAWGFGFHNGVSCERCYDTVCVHCNPDYDKLDDCEEEHWNCPNCGKRVGWKSKYCDCGQAIDWSE